MHILNICAAELEEEEWMKGDYKGKDDDQDKDQTSAFNLGVNGVQW